MRKVILNMKENYKYETIKTCYYKRISKQGAATRLGISTRQVNRLLTTYIQEGKGGFFHKNKGRDSNKKISYSNKNNIITLYKTKYKGSNCKDFTELLAIHEKLEFSETFVRSLLDKNDIYPPAYQKAHEIK